MVQVAIAGVGPTGATLALLLVERGINVTLIEAATDFHRVFRGEGLMPSGLDALEQMGLSHLLEGVPHRKLDGWEFILGKKSLFRVDEPIETGTQPCTLVSQPPLLETLVNQAKKYENFEFLQGVAVKDLLRVGNRVTGVKLSDSREITADVVVGADGRNSVVRQRAGLKLERQPKDMDVLWFKLLAHPNFVENNLFCAIGNGEQAFAVFHGADPGKLHLAWTLTGDTNTDRTKVEWAEIFASLSPSWLAEHFLTHADTIERPIKLSVVIGRCPSWYAPGVILLGDAAHPMAPVRAQGINVALRDVIVTVNHLVPLLNKNAGSEESNFEEFRSETNGHQKINPEQTKHELVDAAFANIQAEREPEIIRVQELQAAETAQNKSIPKNPLLRSLIFKLARLFHWKIRKSWIERQHQMRHGVTNVKLTV